MKHLKNFLFMVFCMPLALFGLFSVGTDGAADDEKDDKSKDAPPSGDGNPPSAGDDLPKTQEELNALIEKRLARERKKMSKQNTPPNAQQIPPAIPPTSGDPATPPAIDNSAELEAANRELLTARAQLEAIKNGVRADVVEDAVYLATREAEKAGEADEDGIKDALKNVLKRHPEWKQQDKQDGKGGFRVGAGDSQQQGATNQTISEIFGNKKS